MYSNNQILYTNEHGVSVYLYPHEVHSICLTAKQKLPNRQLPSLLNRWLTNPTSSRFLILPNARILEKVYL